MEKYVVTITRQFGSMGRPIARKMSEILGIEYYDRDIVDQTAKEMNLPVSTVSDEEEKAHNEFYEFLFPLGIESAERKNRIFKTQRSIITELAEKDSCIVIGRCSDYILRDFPNIINIYIYASYEYRYQRCIHDLNIEPELAKKMINSVDKAREKYHWKYAGYGCMDNKDIMINTELFGVEKTAEILAEIVRQKFCN